MERTSPFPPAIAADIYAQLDERQQVRAELRGFRKYTGYDEYRQHRDQEKYNALADHVAAVEKDILELANHYGTFPSIKEVEEALPLRHEVRRVTIVNAHGSQVNQA